MISQVPQPQQATGEEIRFQSLSPLSLSALPPGAVEWIMKCSSISQSCKSSVSNVVIFFCYILLELH
jgi:hypothetical protein